MTDISQIHRGEDHIILSFDPITIDRSDVARRVDALKSAQCWTEVVLGIDSICVCFDADNMSVERAVDQLTAAWKLGGTSQFNPPADVKLDARIDAETGPDIQWVARQLGIADDALGAWIGKRQYQVSMIGFQPGFPYLQDMAGDCAELDRLATPRTHVSAGSIGFLGNQMCIYPFDGPGGWPIIGRCYAPLFDFDRTPHSLLSIGQPVQFSIQQ